MAKKKPLVLTNGEVEQLQAGDYIQETEFPILTNGETGAIVIGNVVYASGADTVKKAKADASGTSRAIGLVTDPSIAAAASGSIQTGGILAIATTGWDLVTGQTGGLTPNVPYFVSTTVAGNLTPTPASSGYSQEIGFAISSTELLVTAKQVYKL
jgi:hypothetical protein